VHLDVVEGADGGRDGLGLSVQLDGGLGDHSQSSFRSNHLPIGRKLYIKSLSFGSIEKIVNIMILHAMFCHKHFGDYRLKIFTQGVNNIAHLKQFSAEKC
jgi:hypothetical protein